MKKIKQFLKGKPTQAYKMHFWNELHEQKSKKSEFLYFKDCIFISIPSKGKRNSYQEQKEKKKGSSKG